MVYGGQPCQKEIDWNKMNIIENRSAYDFHLYTCRRTDQHSGKTEQ